MSIVCYCCRHTAADVVVRAFAVVLVLHRRQHRLPLPILNQHSATESVNNENNSRCLA